MSGALVVALIAVAGGCWWMWDVHRHPWKTCPRCGNSKRLKGPVPGTHRDCGRCGSTGRVRRFGAREEK